MACDAQTLLTAAAANGYYGLDDRSLMLALCGALSASQSNISASAVMLAGKAFQNLNDLQLEEAIAEQLCLALTP